MKKIVCDRLRFYGFLTAIILLSPTIIFAGIPAQGIVLYGQVFDNSNTLVTSGTLKWKFTLPSPAAPIEMSADLKPLKGSVGIFSYSLILPLEIPLPDYPVSASAIPAGDAAIAVGVSVELTGKSVTRTDSFSISKADIGATRRFSIGDADGDGLPDLWEQKIIDADKTDSLLTIADVNPNDDFDKDGLLNLTEYQLRVSPVVFDNILPGDMDGDDQITLNDALICLKIMNNIDTPGIQLKIFNGVSGDRRIGIQEAIFILKALGGL